MYQETVLSAEHYTDRLFSFKTTRPQGFRFRSGEFTMLGLEDEATGRKIMRAYSIASPCWDDELEFFSIKVPDGPLTSRLQHIKPNDKITLGRKPTGTLVMDALTPAENLYLFSTGTGIAPFASLIRDPDLYEKFDRVILTHTTRNVAELEYGTQLVDRIRGDALFDEIVGDKLFHFTSVTREDYDTTGRITDLITTGKLFQDLGLSPLHTITDRVMICGSMDMTRDMKALCEEAGMVEGSVSRPGDFVVEKAFVG